jgi:hypothetical protein
MLRDPIDRIASLYDFWKQIGHGETDLKNKTLEQFALFLPEKINGYLKDNHLVRVFCPHPHTRFVPVGNLTSVELLCAMRTLRDEYELVLIMERFDESLELLEWGLDRGGNDPTTKPLEQREGSGVANSSGRHSNVASTLDPSTLSAMRKITHLDAELYDFAKCLFRSQLQAFNLSKNRP